jgi:hypothetical protein
MDERRAVLAGCRGRLETGRSNVVADKGMHVRSLRPRVLAALVVAMVAAPMAVSAGAGASGIARGAPKAVFQPVLQAFGASDLVGATCPTSTVCLAIGRLDGYGMFYRSTDGGTSWSSAPQPDGAVTTWSDGTLPVSISCASSTFCVLEVVSNNYDGDDVDGFDVSHDAGGTWTTAHGTIALPTFNDQSLGMTGLSCTGTGTCVGMLDGAVESTTNAGATWSHHKDVAVVGVACPFVRRCYVVQDASAPGGRSLLTVSSSENRGGTLTRLLRLVGHWNVPPAISCPTRIACALATSGTGAGFESTADGGRTWRAHAPLTITADERIQALVCEAPGVCTELASKSSQPNLTVSISTTTGGVNTSGYATIARLGTASAIPTLSCLGSSCVATLGTRSTFAITQVQNSSATWHGNPIAIGTPSLSAVACEQNGSCLAIGTGIEASSGDDGQTWSVHTDAALAGDTFSALTCPFATTCIASGNAGSSAVPTGLVLVTGDLGAHWAAGALPWEVGYLHKVSCDPTGAVCLGIPGFGSSLANIPTLLARSTDGGLTWTLVTVAPASAFDVVDGVACPSASRCVAVGATYLGPPAHDTSTTTFVELSSDAGATWMPAPATPPGLGFGDVACSAALACVSTGSPPIDDSFGVARAYTTSDGGATWTAQGTFDLADGYSSAAFTLDCTITLCAGLALSVFEMEHSPPGIAVVTSADGGGTWSEDPTPLSARESNFEAEPQSLYVDQVGMAIAADGSVLVVGSNADDGPLILSGTP